MTRSVCLIYWVLCRMMVCMVLSFVLAWLPLNLINLSRDFYGVSSLFSILFALCHVIAMTSAVWNPVIYSWFNPQLRTTIKGVLKKTPRDMPLQQRVWVKILWYREGTIMISAPNHLKHLQFTISSLSWIVKVPQCRLFVYRLHRCRSNKSSCCLSPTTKMISSEKERSLLNLNSFEEISRINSLSSPNWFQVSCNHHNMNKEPVFT